MLFSKSNHQAVSVDSSSEQKKTIRRLAKAKNEKNNKFNTHKNDAV